MALRTRMGGRKLLDVETDSVRDVSDAEFREEYARKKRVYQPGEAPTKRIRLWDNIEEAWTGILPQQHALEFNLKMVVERCSACPENSSGIGGHKRDIANHFQRIRDRASDHRGSDTKIMYLPAIDGVIPSCTACGQTFRSKPQQATKHIDMVLEEAKAHKDASQLTVRRFSLEPPVLTFPDSRGEVRPELQQVERNPQKRRRKRSHGRKREMVHG